MEIFESKILFSDVQLGQVFADGKTFVDCIPKSDMALIEQQYIQSKATPGFDLKKFVLENFELPKAYSSDFESNKNNSTAQHIEQLWEHLSRKDSDRNQSTGSLIPLPYPYIVPGGRFGEIYYWDSYFTMLGLQVSGKNELIEGMIDNFAYLIDRVGYIPNGNRSYFIGRSQPPFFALMIELLVQIKGDAILEKYLPFLEKEYHFWMSQRAINTQDGEQLNRYFDAKAEPRPESYREDLELAHSHNSPTMLWLNLRAACESGWDFSSRWFKNQTDFASIHTSDLIPVDLNCLIYKLELLLAKAKPPRAKEYLQKAENRKQAIQKYCWNAQKGFFFDFDFVENKQKSSLTLAGVFPLFCGIASQEQAQKVAEVLEVQFLKKGGLITTTIESGQQWDAPNGWAPLQWLAYEGLKKYGITTTAQKIRTCWLTKNDEVYEQSGKMTEKYNVSDNDNQTGGGEYPNQDGFGWTNGVYLKMLNS
jgi:alpha,alpha-trehalase